MYSIYQSDFPKEIISGSFVRQDSSFRKYISKRSEFSPDPKRYHIYLSYACPWAHRTLIFRTLKGLEKLISLSVVNWYMAEDGWTFKDTDGVISDRVNGAHFLHKVYTAAVKDYT